MIPAQNQIEMEFKDTEIGLIPADWDVIRLGEVVRTSRKPRSLDLSTFDAIPFIPMELIPQEGLYADKYVLKKPDEISSGSYCENGDLLLAKITPSFENGKQGVITNIPLDFAYATTEIFALMSFTPQSGEKVCPRKIGVQTAQG